MKQDKANIKQFRMQMQCKNYLLTKQTSHLYNYYFSFAFVCVSYEYRERKVCKMHVI